MRSKYRLVLAWVVGTLLWLWPAFPTIAAPKPQTTWEVYTNAAWGWAIRYPREWGVNQGALGPLGAGRTTKFSTYRAGQPAALTADDAEVWVTVTDAATDFSPAGYTERQVTVAGLPATRYTAAQPAFGIYDVVIILAGERVYRVHLSASTHAFDAIFQAMLDSLEINADYHGDADFSLRYPQSWTWQAGEGSLSLLPADAEGKVRFSVTAVAGAGLAERVIAEPVDQLHRAGSIEGLEKFAGVATLPAGAAPKLSYRYVRKTDSVEIKGLALGVQNGEVVYILQYTATPDYYERWLSSFDRLAAGFRVHTPATIAEILARPKGYRDQLVTLRGEFLGWRKPAAEQPATIAPPVSRSDWLIQDKGEALYVQAGARLSAGSLAPQPANADQAGRRLRVSGFVRLTEAGQPYVEPVGVYPEVAGAWLRDAAPADQGLALELKQVGALLYGEARLTAGDGQTAARPISGSLVAGGKLRLKNSDAGPLVEIEGALADNGRSFSGSLKRTSGPAEPLAMTWREPTLPTTGSDMSWLTHLALGLLAAGLLGGAGLGAALVMAPGRDA